MSEIARDDLLRHLDDLLAARGGKDYCPNGLQIEGKSTIGKIVTGVSACLELHEAAVARGADAVLVHHGLFWHGQSPLLVGLQFRRVAALLDHRINLLAYHLPLDRHLELGNNAVAARGLGLGEIVPWGEYEGQSVGVRGRFRDPVPAAELVDRCRRFYGQEPLAVGRGPARIERVGIISGAAQRELHRAIAEGCDAFVTGEISEWVPNVANEAGIHYLACGHYATERCGIQALGDHLAATFGVTVEFVEVGNVV
jgi:dinuclear metal center YbgI/SA1388 family protein